MKLKLLTLTAIGAAAAFAAGCGTDATNTNTARNTAVTTNANSNVAVLVNNNSSMANTARRGDMWNANITREEYDKNKAEYDKEVGSSTIGQGVNDKWLWVKTRASLLGTEDLRESTINVDVVNDVVTLKGTVGTAAQKAKAVQVAKAIEGVKSVKDELKVAPNDSITNTADNDNKNTNANKKK